MKIVQGSRDSNTSRKFLQAISAFTGPLPFARGTVTEVSGTPEFALASIEWDNPGGICRRRIRSTVKMQSECLKRVHIWRRYDLLTFSNYNMRIKKEDYSNAQPNSLRSK